MDYLAGKLQRTRCCCHGPAARDNNHWAHGDSHPQLNQAATMTAPAAKTRARGTRAVFPFLGCTLFLNSRVG